METYYTIKNVADAGYYTGKALSGGRLYSSVPKTFFATEEDAREAVGILSESESKDNFRVLKLTEEVVE